MPTYSFMCGSCNKSFDKVTRIKDREIPLTDPCPLCGETGSITRNFQDSNQQFTDSWSLGYKKPPEDWRGFLSAMKKANPGSDFNHG